MSAKIEPILKLKEKPKAKKMDLTDVCSNLNEQIIASEKALTLLENEANSIQKQITAQREKIKKLRLMYEKVR